MIFISQFKSILAKCLYFLQITTPTTTTTTTTTTTEAPLIIRQRVRARLGPRKQRPEEASVQTKNYDSDEYVRFNAVNKESNNVASQPSRPRTRVRARPQTGNSQIQTDGGYVRIQSGDHPRRATTTTTTTQAPSTTVAEETKIQNADDNNFGFIRTPNFRQRIEQEVCT